MVKELYKDELKVLLINGSAILGAYVLKRATEKMLESAFNKTAPKKSSDKDEEFSWIEAVGWAAFTGAMASTLKLFIKRGAKIQLDKLF